MMSDSLLWSCKCQVQALSQFVCLMHSLSTEITVIPMLDGSFSGCIVLLMLAWRTYALFSLDQSYIGPRYILALSVYTAL